MKNIVISNAYALAVCQMKYGENNKFYYLEEIPTSSRHKGRNFHLQQRLLLETARLLNIDIKGVTEDFIVDLMLQNNYVVIDWRINAVLKKSLAIAENSSKKDEMNKYIEVFVNGADFLQSFSPKWRDLLGPRIRKDNKLWRSGLSNYGNATFIFPGFSKFGNLSSRYDKVEFIPRETLNLDLMKLSQEMISLFFPKIEVNFNAELIFINPESSNIELFEKQLPKYSNILEDFSRPRKAIIKLHPSTIDPENFIRLFSKFFKNELDLLFVEDFELLTAFPLEFLLIGFPNSKFVGFHSTSTSVLTLDRVWIIESADRQINRTIKRSFNEFYKLMKNK